MSQQPCDEAAPNGRQSNRRVHLQVLAAFLLMSGTAAVLLWKPRFRSSPRAPMRPDDSRKGQRPGTTPKQKTGGWAEAVKERHEWALAPDPKGRPKLVFSHLPKTGGSFVRRHLPGLIPRELLAVLQEFDPPLAADGDGDSSALRTAVAPFVLGTMRAPCDYYLSLWSYGSHGKGALHEDATAHGEERLYGTTPPFDNDADKERLGQWLLHNAGLLTARAQRSFGGTHWSATGPSVGRDVDCWLRTEALTETLRGCLEEYEARGGEVLWGGFPGPEEPHVNTETHASCADMFDKDLEKLVRRGDPLIFNAFDLSACCPAS